MRALPDMLVVCPGDPLEARLATQALIDYQGPAFLRIGRAGEPQVHKSMPEFKLGKAITLRPGRDITLISTGGMLANTVAAAQMLSDAGVEVQVLSMHTVKPLDTAAVLAAARNTLAIFTVEEHSIIGGLGGAVAEVIAESGVYPKLFKRIGLDSTFSSIVGDQSYLLQQYGLSPEGIVNTVEVALEAAKLH